MRTFHSNKLTMQTKREATYNSSTPIFWTVVDIENLKNILYFSQFGFELN